MTSTTTLLERSDARASVRRQEPLIDGLTYRRTNHARIRVRGYKEEGTTTTPFDMLMLNDMDRFHLAMDVIDRVPGLATAAAGLRQRMGDERVRHRAYTSATGDDPPTITDWTWPFGEEPDAGPRRRSVGRSDRGRTSPRCARSTGDLASSSR